MNYIITGLLIAYALPITAMQSRSEALFARLAEEHDVYGEIWENTLIASASLSTHVTSSKKECFLCGQKMRSFVLNQHIRARHLDIMLGDEKSKSISDIIDELSILWPPCCSWPDCGKKFLSPNIIRLHVLYHLFEEKTATLPYQEIRPLESERSESSSAPKKARLATPISSLPDAKIEMLHTDETLPPDDDLI